MTTPKNPAAVEKYAWYSQKMAEKLGSVTWMAADGTPITCTSVSPTQDHGLGYDDVKFVGMVERWGAGKLNFEDGRYEPRRHSEVL